MPSYHTIQRRQGTLVLLGTREEGGGHGNTLGCIELGVLHEVLARTDRISTAATAAVIKAAALVPFPPLPMLSSGLVCFLASFRSGMFSITRGLRMHQL